MTSIHFNKKYFLFFTILFITEVLIALYIHDDFIRPFFGDYLVVFLVYCFIMSFINSNKYRIAFGVLVFAFAIEYIQYIDFVSTIGLQKSKLASTIIGTSFSVEDLVIYILAFVSIISLESIFDKYNYK
ncbi:DUF2809 domain-containing protein [Flavobacterium sp.]|uniref:ribosomal maturation YjgA family protein n=1 Tax=Flavobacterium sp. TaxID=239 RepID=UPI003750349A